MIKRNKIKEDSNHDVINDTMNTIAKAAEESTDMFCFPYQVCSLRLPFNFRSDIHDTSPCDSNT